MVGNQKMKSYFLWMSMNGKNKKWQEWFLRHKPSSEQTGFDGISKINRNTLPFQSVIYMKSFRAKRYISGVSVLRKSHFWVSSSKFHWEHET